MAKNLLNWLKSLDRDKEKEGFQVFSPKVRNAVDTYAQNKLVRDDAKLQKIQDRRDDVKKVFTKDFWEKGFQNVGYADQQKGMDQYFTPLKSTPFVDKLVQSPVGFPLRFAQGFGQNVWEGANRSAEYGRKAHIQAQKNREAGMGMLESAVQPNVLKPSAFGYYQSVKSLAKLKPIGGPKAIPGALLASGLSSIVGGIRGEDRGKAAGEGFGEGLGVRVVTNFTDPVIEKILGVLAPNAKVFAQQIAKRVGGGTLNIGEDRIIAKLEEEKPGIMDDLFSFGIGFLVSGNDQLVEIAKNDLDLPESTVRRFFSKLDESVKNLFNKPEQNIKIAPEQKPSILKQSIEQKMDANVQRIFKNDKYISQFQESYQKAIVESENYEQFIKNLVNDLSSKNKGQSKDSIEAIVRQALPDDFEINFGRMKPEPSIKIAQEKAPVPEPPVKIADTPKVQEDIGVDTGNKITRVLRKVFLDTEDSLKKTFGSLYDSKVAPILDTYFTRLDVSARWAKDYYTKLEELNIKPGTKDDKLIRQFQKEDGFEKVAMEVGQEKALQLQNVYKSLRTYYDEIINTINIARKSAGLSELPKKADFLSQIGSKDKSILESSIEGTTQTTRPTSEKIFKKQGSYGTTGAIESMRDYIQFAQRAAFSDLTAKDFRNLRLELSKDKNVPEEALKRLKEVEDNIFGIKDRQQALDYLGKWQNVISATKVIGKISTLLNQLLGIPQGASATRQHFFTGLFSKEASQALEKSRFSSAIKDRPPMSLNSPGFYNNLKGYMAEFLANGQEFSNDVIWKGFFQQARSAGKSFDEAVKVADSATPKIVADRRLGMSPEIYQTYFGKIFGRFTVEPTAAIVRLADSFGKRKFMEVLTTLASWHLMNDLIEDHVYGYRPYAGDPVDWVDNFMENWNGTDEVEKNRIRAVTVTFANILASFPLFNSAFNMAYSLGEIAGALPDSEEVFGNSDQTWMNPGGLINPFQNFDRNITNNKWVDKPLNLASNIIPGLEQPLKTTQSIISMNRGYTLTKDGSPGHIMPDSPWGRGQAAIFGQSSNKEAQEFYGNDYSDYLTDSQKRAFDTIKDKDEKVAFLVKAQDSAKKINKAKSDIKIAKDDKKGFFNFKKEEEPVVTNTSDQLVKDERKNTVRELIKTGNEVNDEDLRLYYLDDYDSMPDKTNYEKNQKVEQAFTTGKIIMDDKFLPQEAKDKLYKEMEVSEEELEYFKISGSEKDDDQLMYLQEQISTMGDDEKLEFLLRGRTKVNDYPLVTDSLLKSLVKSGDISQSVSNALKSVYFVKDNSYTGDDAIKMGDNIYKPVKNTAASGGGSGFGTDNVKKVKMPEPKRTKIESIKISTGSSGTPYTIKITKPNLSKRKNWRSINILKDY